jgi:universal stress protein E
MAKQLRRVLVAIGNLQHPSKNELHKAAALAKASGASVELFHAIGEPDPARSYPETATREAVEQLRAAIVARSERRLERFARDKSLLGVRVTCSAVWDRPVYDAIARRAQATHADLVIATTRGRRFGARLVLRNTDWELIRHCPAPLLLVKSHRPYHKPVVLAAVDPFHAHAKPAGLDVRLLDAASQFAQLLHGTVHVFHAYVPLVNVDTIPLAAAPPVVLSATVEEVHRQQVAHAVDQLAEKAGIPPGRRHINMGEVSVELSAVTRRTHTSLVVMGAVSRSALARLFIGNTAERVLDKLSCDVLVVKPKGFNLEAARRQSASKGPNAKPGARAVVSRSARHLSRDFRSCEATGLWPGSAH